LTIPIEYVKNGLVYSFWDYFSFVLVILAIVGIIYLLSRFDKRIKVRYKKTAYSLLDEERPDLKKVKDTIKGLRLYGGRWFKDKECVQLVARLQDKYGSLL
jgi:hypothetical protein